MEKNDKLLLEFYAAKSRKSAPVARIHINKAGGIKSVSPKKAMNKQQRDYLSGVLSEKGHNPLYEQIFDFLVERGIEGSCGFSPEQKRVYFVSNGEDPINEFFGER